MPITRTPIIDDDGTGTTGTVLNSAWKQELYNQIDGTVGTWTEVPFNAGHFTGTAPMTWTVGPAAVIHNRYSVTGRTMFWSFYFSWFSGGNVLSGSPSASLNILVPGGLTPRVNQAVVIGFQGGIAGTPSVDGLYALTSGTSPHALQECGRQFRADGYPRDDHHRLLRGLVMAAPVPPQGDQRQYTERPLKVYGEQYRSGAPLPIGTRTAGPNGEAVPPYVLARGLSLPAAGDGLGDLQPLQWAGAGGDLGRGVYRAVRRRPADLARRDAIMQEHGVLPRSRAGAPPFARGAALAPGRLRAAGARAPQQSDPADRRAAHARPTDATAARV